MKAASAPNNNMPISVRPSQEARKQLAQIAKELRKSDAQVITDFLTDALEMLSTGQYGVPPTVNMIRVLRENRATFASPAAPVAEHRDKREVAFYQDGGVSAGSTSGACTDNPPAKITVPASITAHVDFATRVCGDSMEPMVHDGEIALFRHAEDAPDGRVVCVLIDGQTMLKMFVAKNGGPARFVSLNPKYPPIASTADTRIQGVYEGKLPATAAKRARK